MGGMTESLIVDADADTPSLNFDSSQTSFTSNSIISEAESINGPEILASLRCNTGGDSPIKTNDMRNSLMRQSTGLFGSVKFKDSEQRKALENQLCNSGI